jgi:hypothetical protein
MDHSWNIKRNHVLSPLRVLYCFKQTLVFLIRWLSGRFYEFMRLFEMKSKLKLLLLVVLLVLLILFAYDYLKDEGDSLKRDHYYVELGLERYSVSEGISTAIEETLSLSALPDSMNVTISNLSDSGYMFLDFLLEKKTNNSWSTFPPYPTEDIGYYIDQNSSFQKRFYILDYHEKMDAGLYRIVSLVSRASHQYDYSGDTQMVTCEFFIE